VDSKEACGLKIGDQLEHRPSGRKAKVLAPAKPKYVMIEWHDDGAKECPWVEWMADFVRIDSKNPRNKGSHS
jgi:hypothetical protein